MKKTETQVILVKLEADEGKIFAKKETNEVLGSTLILGKNDSADNYIEVDKPISTEEE